MHTGQSTHIAGCLHSRETLMKHLVCPACRSRIVVADGDTGKPIRCPACEEPYPTPGAAVEEVIEVLPAPAAPASPAPVPAPRSAPRSRGCLMPVAVVVVLCAGCGLCVGVGGIAGGYLWGR